MRHEFKNGVTHTHACNIGTVIEQAMSSPMWNQWKTNRCWRKKRSSGCDQRKAGEPFFLYYPLGIPHEPIVPSDEFAGKSRKNKSGKSDNERSKEMAFTADANFD